VKTLSRYLTIDENFHAYMRELARRRKCQIGALYMDVMRWYLRKNKTPKRVEKAKRMSVTMQVTEEYDTLMEDIRLHAVKRKQFPVVVLEEAIAQWLNEPEQYVGQRFDQEFNKSEYVEGNELQKTASNNHQRRKA